MMSHLYPVDDHHVAFLDLGTNSARLLLVRVNANRSYTVITQQKEFVRLGEGEFTDDELQPAAMDRAVLVCRKFADLARSYQAQEIIAVATAAVRDAQNQREIIQRLNDEAQVDIRVISGREEARLIFLGVASGVHLGTQQAMIIDIGGGSTEIIVGDQHTFHDLDSLKLGAIRLTMQFLAGETGPVSPLRYATIQQSVRNTALRPIQRMRPTRPQLAFGSSGTIDNLAAISARLIHKRQPLRHELLTAQDLRQVVTLLCALPLEERRKVPGINPERADIIIAGAAILETLMQELELPHLHVSHRGLLDGMLVDYLTRTESIPAMKALSVRAQSVVRLGRICNFDERHAAHVSRLAMELFDSARECKLHSLGDWERELLGWAAQLHDIGTFLNYANHHAHSYYFIRNADLLGFDQTELAIIAATAYFHRRKILPRKRHPEYAALDSRAQQIVRVLCVLLRLAESLDRSHAGLVESVSLCTKNHKNLIMAIHGKDCQLELWGVQAHASAVEKVFRHKLVIADPLNAEME